MMDCGDGLGHLAAKTEYSTLNQLQEISNMLGDNATCTILAQHEFAIAYYFQQRLQEALVEDMPTIIQINAEMHTDDGILSNNTWWQPNYMATHIEATMKERKHSIKAIILNLPKAHYLAYEMKAMDSIPIYCQHASGHILATAYAGIYNTPTNNEINGIIDLSMSMSSMDRVTRPWANTKEAF